LRLVKQAYVGDRAIDRLSLLGIEGSFGRGEFRRADLDRRERNAIEPSREFEQG
jgi:hypothetical protein